MTKPLIFPMGDTPVMGYAATFLQELGLAVADAPSPDVTHVLLPIPLKPTMPLSPSVTVIGGNLDAFRQPHMDLLKDELYLSQNAMITAQVAVNLAVTSLPIILEGCPTLILGWGRIGKCLMQLLKVLGADVTVAARKPSDRGMICALGCTAADISMADSLAHRYRLIFNTVPYPVMNTANCRQDCVKIELASTQGLMGDDILQARGLPGKYAPESSGRLIAETIHRLLEECI